MELSNSTVMTSGERLATFSLASLISLRMLGLFMIMPVFSLYGGELDGAGPALIGLAIGIYGLTQAICQIPFGLLSDRIGRKPVIYGGLVLFAIGGVVAAQAETIYGVILGRGIQGAGAIASAIMALLGDVTREENRTKAMAIMGMSIGVSFSLALVLGPIITSFVGLSGLFWITTAMALVGIGICYWVVPNPVTRIVHRDSKAEVSELKKVLRHRELLRLDIGIFLLHLVMTACFVVLPLVLVNQLHLDIQKHWLVYLPILITSFVAMVPLMIFAERKKKIKEVLILAVFLLMLGLLGLFLLHDKLWTLCLALFVYFMAFNLLEAMLPSLVSKIAPAGSKGTCMGVYSSAQFFGAFAGGTMGGVVYGIWGAGMVFLFGAGLMIIWLFVALSMEQPRFLQSYLLKLDSALHVNAEQLLHRLLAVVGVEEAVVITEENVAYLKVDKQSLDYSSLQKLATVNLAPKLD
ncbi:MAG: MFS transporter [Pseudomonadales bacterium]|nr:MFS transporter [Pseudomonadales bacterium]